MVLKKEEKANGPPLELPPTTQIPFWYVVFLARANGE